jgi:hypothetical protein
VLDQALPRIAYLTVHIEPAGTQANVLIGDAPVPGALIGAERPTDPGTHEVSVSAEGFLTTKATVELSEGEHESLTLKLEPDPNAAAAGDGPAAPAETGATPAGAPGAPPPQQDASGGGNTVAWVLLGVGGVGLAVGAVTGGIAMGQASDLKSKCDDDILGNCTQDDIDSTKSLAMISNIGFGVGAAAVVVGVILLASGGNQETARRELPAVQPYVGLGNAGVVGRF